MIPKDAIPLEDWERIEQGLSPLPKKREIRPEPEFPKVENRIDFESIPLDKVMRINAVRKNVIKNKEGVRFIGYDIEIELKDLKPLQGWLLEGELVRLVPLIREKTDQAMLHSIGY